MAVRCEGYTLILNVSGYFSIKAFEPGVSLSAYCATFCGVITYKGFSSPKTEVGTSPTLSEEVLANEPSHAGMLPSALPARSPPKGFSSFLSFDASAETDKHVNDRDTAIAALSNLLFIILLPIKMCA